MIRFRLAAVIVCLLTPMLWAAEEPEGLPVLADKTEGLTPLSGLVDLWLDPDAGRVWLAVPPPDEVGISGTYLYLEGLTTGLGSNPVGLDRGQLGPARLVRLRRIADRVFIEQPNLRFRGDETVEQSFATSVLWAGPIAARDDDGRTLVDLTSFLIRDAHGVADVLKRSGQGSFALDPERSAIDFSQVLAFPRNVELEAVLTYAGTEPGNFVQQTAPSPDSVTLVQHHSLVALPEPGFKRRVFDPNAGSFSVDFLDYRAPLEAPLERKWIVKHRIEKDRPILYYVDRGAPEPVRSALLDGARWWTEAFEAAGHPAAFKVELLPEGVHPLDVRYNVIQWVHRRTRGWSYGGGVIDPRTGEMIKGHVSLGSLRVRQDIRLFEGLLGTAKTGHGTPDDPVQLALARIRQLSAHEVGHTLGLNHNFAASTYGRASVMDYPAPWVKLDVNGEIAVVDAYAVGVGAWDIAAIRYAHAEAAVAPPTELLFLTDEDARPEGAAHPLANLWDNGSDPVLELRRVLDVRRVALQNFDESRVAVGRPLAELEEVLAPVYFYHRYQVEAAAKTLGGVDYVHAVRGRGQPGATPVDAERQRRALRVLLGALSVDVLDLPEPVARLILPRAAGMAQNRELFHKRTAPVFDRLGAAESAADLVLRFVLQPERLARLADQHREDPAIPSVDDVVEAVIATAFDQEGEVGDVVRSVTAGRLTGLAGDPEVAVAVRTSAERGLGRMLERVGGDTFLGRSIDRFLTKREWESPTVPMALPMPPGSPIGCSFED